MLAALLLTVVTTATLASPSQPGPVERSDLPPAFAAAVCAGETGTLPIRAWAAGVFDAQLEGRFLTRPDGLPVPTERLLHAARSLALLRGANGYAYGQCEGGRAYVIALPAPLPLKTQASVLALPAQALDAHCASWRADFAPQAVAAPRSLTATARIDGAKLGDGVLSVTCQPRSPRWRGPLTWYLAPVGKGPADAPPAFPAAGPDAGQGEAAPLLTSWINRIRAQLSLPALLADGDLSAQASLLATDGSLNHDRLQLQRAAGRLGPKIRLLGEDRVKAKDPRTMAWLIWNSPRHRELILSRDAAAIGVGTRQVGDEQLVVIATGATAPLKTALGPGKKRQRPSATR